tara:strand:+ start:600 stop:1523 length:924 start_codon:yes stop_codon:yes gene_type:complete
MPEGIKSLATTAGYFAPGAGILDALGMYPDENSQSMLANLKAGEFGRAGFQGLGALGDALMLTGVGAPIGASMKMVSRTGQLGRAGKQAMARTRMNRSNIFSKTEPTALDNVFKMKGKEWSLGNKGVMDFLTPKTLGGDKERVKYAARAFDDYATKNRSIAGRTFDEGGKGSSKYFMIKKDIGLGPNSPANIGVRISDHAPTKKGVTTRGMKDSSGNPLMNSDVMINVGPKGKGFEATTLDDAIEMIENMHIKEGNIENLVRSGEKVSRKHLGTAKVVKGKVIPVEPPMHIYRAGGQLPFGLDVTAL